MRILTALGYKEHFKIYHLRIYKNWFFKIKNLQMGDERDTISSHNIIAYQYPIPILILVHSEAPYSFLPDHTNSHTYGTMLCHLSVTYVILLYLWSKRAAEIGSNRVTWCKLIWGIDRFTGLPVNTSITWSSYRPIEVLTIKMVFLNMG